MEFPNADIGSLAHELPHPLTLEVVVNILLRQMSDEPRSFLCQCWGSCREVALHPAATTEEASDFHVPPLHINDPPSILLWSQTHQIKDVFLTKEQWVLEKSVYTAFFSS